MANHPFNAALACVLVTTAATCPPALGYYWASWTTITHDPINITHTTNVSHLRDAPDLETRLYHTQYWVKRFVGTVTVDCGVGGNVVYDVDQVGSGPSGVRIKRLSVPTTAGSCTVTHEGNIEIGNWPDYINAFRKDPAPKQSYYLPLTISVELGGSGNVSGASGTVVMRATATTAVDADGVIEFEGPAGEAITRELKITTRNNYFNPVTITVSARNVIPGASVLINGYKSISLTARPGYTGDGVVESSVNVSANMSRGFSGTIGSILITANQY